MVRIDHKIGGIDMKINTVKGPIETSELGTTLMHEHVCCADWSMRMNFGARFFDFDTVVETAAAMFTKMKRDCGVMTVVDGTPVNLGRDVRLIRAVAERTGLNFIVSSGFYYQEEPGLAFYPEEQLTGLLLGECLNGIDGTDILPGIMKAAVETGGVTTVVDGTPGNLGRDVRLIRAVAERTGVRFIASGGFY